MDILDIMTFHLTSHIYLYLHPFRSSFMFFHNELILFFSYHLLKLFLITLSVYYYYEYFPFYFFIAGVYECSHFLCVGGNPLTYSEFSY